MPKRIPSLDDPYRDPDSGKLTLCVDFHGVIHSHSTGNTTSEIADDPPVPGAFEWLSEVSQVFRVAIVCARFGVPGQHGVNAMTQAKEWFLRKGFRQSVGVDPLSLPAIYLAAVKPRCHLLLDDRAVTFNGTFPDPRTLRDFRPWNR